MSSINDVRIVGLLVRDAEIRTIQDKRQARLTVQTFKFWRDRSNQARKTAVTHTLVCYKQSAIPMLEQYAKNGKWIKVLGELSYDKDGRAEVVVAEGMGDIGMMNLPTEGETAAPAAAPQAQPAAAEPEKTTAAKPATAPVSKPAASAGLPSSAARTAGGIGKLGSARPRDEAPEQPASNGASPGRPPNQPDPDDADIPF